MRSEHPGKGMVRREYALSSTAVNAVSVQCSVLGLISSVSAYGY